MQTLCGRGEAAPLLALNRKGCNRWVLLTRRYAFKFPALSSWQDFLFGLLNNMNEAREHHLPGRCPILWSLPGGLLVVMPRVEIMNEVQFQQFDPGVFNTEYTLNVEHKPDSYGFLDGKIVAVDYGW
ncbi:MAG TPA: hypothetical protein VGN79_12415 [Devosia sp.]|jgi:hypothetical protein|nr:hypothetical protein [Devosia sp.]